MQVVSLEGLIEFKEEWLWHDGFMEVLSGRNEFELVGVIDITVESPGYWRMRESRASDSSLDQGIDAPQASIRRSSCSRRKWRWRS
jgi:hypothetical protein